jgi:hypothetical protein
MAIVLKLCCTCEEERQQQIVKSGELIAYPQDRTLIQMTEWMCLECQSKAAQAIRLMLSGGWIEMP